jgi:type II secretory pathway pseudopilin PulG
MIKFFRQIRQQMIKENRVSKYLLYAIGEIVLVVIGILIALQINTWNEVKKTQKFEQEILFLIDQNLQQDSVLLSAELKKARMANELTDRLLEQVALQNYNDSLNRWMGKIISFERFKSQSSAFEVLKSKGIETISDKELQMDLISYYDVGLFQVYQSLNDVENAFNADWVPVLKSDISDFKWMDYCIPINSKAFFEKPSTLVLFKLFQDNREGTVRNIENAIQKIAEIRTKTKPNLE